MSLLPLYSKTNPPPGPPTGYHWEDGDDVIAMWGPMGHECRCVDHAGQHTVYEGDYIIRDKDGGLRRISEESRRKYATAASLTIKEMLNTTQTDDDIAAERHSAPTTPQED